MKVRTSSSKAQRRQRARARSVDLVNAHASPSFADAVPGAAPASMQTQTVSILALGDSLTEG